MQQSIIKRNKKVLNIIKNAIKCNENVIKYNNKFQIYY